MDLNRRVCRVALLVLLVLAGCSPAPAPAQAPPAAAATPARGSLSVVGFNFAESTLLVYLYGKPLMARGYTVEIKPNLGTRETLQPALTSGQVDMYVGYAATDLEFVNKAAGEASADIQPTLAKLRERYQPLGVDVLDAAPAVDKTVFAVTRATAEKLHVSKISDLTPIAGDLVLGAPPQCPQRPFCLPGLQRVYGLNFKDFKALDPGGPLTKEALDAGQIDVALLLSSDGAIPARDYAVLDDDKHLELADNVVPMIRTAVDNPEITQVVNAVSAKLTTPDLAGLNKRAAIDHEEADALATEWLKSKGLLP